MEERHSEANIHARDSEVDSSLLWFVDTLQEAGCTNNNDLVNEGI